MRPDFVCDLSSEALDHLRERDVVIVAKDAPELNAWLQSVDASAVIVRPVPPASMTGAPTPPACSGCRRSIAAARCALSEWTTASSA
jgi:hypothetical protein